MKPDLKHTDIPIDLRDFLERPDARASGAAQTLQPLRYENSVLTHQRNQVRDRPESDEVEKRFHVVVPGVLHSSLPRSLEHRVCDLERETGRAKLVESGLTVLSRLRIDDDVGIRSRIGKLMVIEHQHVDARIAKPGDRLVRCRTAVNREQELGWKSSETVFHAHLAQPVALLQAMREIGRNVGPTKHGEHFLKDRRGCHTVDVVVPENDKPLAVLHRLPQPIDQAVHSRNEIGVGELLELGIEEAGCLVEITESAIHEASSKQR